MAESSGRSGGGVLYRVLADFYAFLLLGCGHHRFRVVLWKGSDPGGRDLGHQFTTENRHRLSGFCKISTNQKNRFPCWLNRSPYSGSRSRLVGWRGARLARVPV